MEVGGGVLTLDITGLTPFTNYTVYVAAETVAVGDQSPGRTVLTLEDGELLCIHPYNYMGPCAYIHHVHT